MSKNNITIESIKEGFLTYQENTTRETLEKQRMPPPEIEKSILKSKDLIKG